MSNQMKEIDWSKAPEGAQGYMPKSIIWAEGWWKDICGNRFFCHAGQDEWKETHANAFGLHGFVYRHDSAQGAAWSGDGLPPVGTVCEAWHNGSAQGVVEVRYAGDCMVLWNVKLKHEQCSVAENYSFRPIRTPEQIAAEERESHINGMLCHDALGGTRRGLAEALYDAGYRKVTP